MNMDDQHNLLEEVSPTELAEVSGAGLFYKLGAFFAEVANANDSIYQAYGNTNMNHHW